MSDIVTAYHFTSRLILPRIMREGILKGDVPISAEKGLNAPWLTLDPAWTDRGIKGEVRLTVQAKDLTTWEEICRKFDVEPLWAQAAGIPATHRVKLGGVHPAAIMAVDFRERLEILEPQFDGRVLYLQPHGTSQKPGRVEWESLTPREYVARIENWIPLNGSEGPWEDIPESYMKMLASDDPEWAANDVIATMRRLHVNMHHSRYPGTSIATTSPAEQAIRGLARWVQSGRELIEISDDAAKKLEAIPTRFSGIGEGKSRMFKLKTKGHIYFDKCDLFFERNASPQELLVLISPDPEGVRFCCWGRAQGEKWRVITDGSPTMSAFTPLEDGLELMKTWGPNGMPVNLVQELRICVNAFVAMSMNPRVQHLQRHKAKPKGRPSAKPSQKSVTLTEDALATIIRQWEEFPEPAPQRKTGEEPTMIKSPVTLHAVRPHDFYTWVLQPRSGESTFGVKSDGVRVLWKVLRRRAGPGGGAYSRGEGRLEASKSRLKSGPDDIQLRLSTWGAE